MSNSREHLFDKRTQVLIALFALFIAFPVLEIPFIDISITFPMFLWICHRIKKRSKQRLFVISTTFDKLMLAFVVMAALSIIVAPKTDVEAGLSLLIKDSMSLLYLAYWLGVYLFFRRWYQCLQLQRMSLFMLIGIMLSTGVVLLGHVTSGGYYVIGPIQISQNAYAFNAVACMGMGAHYLMIQQKTGYVLLYALGMIYPMLRSGSRTGVIIMTLQALVITMFAVFDKHRNVRRLMVHGAVILLIGTAFFWTSVDYGSIGQTLGAWVEPYNPDLALLLKDPEQVNERDKSWLIRKAQVDKGLDLFMKYPLAGVGWGHFRSVRGDIDVKQYKYLVSEYDSYALRRSSHNSYIQVLAETGLLGFIPLALIQLLILKCVFQYLLRSHSIAKVLPFGISLLGVAIYFWTISSITGAVWYLLVGLFGGVVENERGKNNESRILLPHSRPML